jgi:ATP-dependent Clp protease protease subunit
MKKFWQWKSNKVLNSENVETEERVLVLNGTIADESWYGDEVTPKIFRDELMAGEGDIYSLDLFSRRGLHSSFSDLYHANGI